MNNFPKLLIDSNVVIVGFGLIGGSMALALKDHCRSLSALDSDENALTYGLKKKMIHAASSNPSIILKDADLIILACPVKATIDWIQRLSDFITQPCVVIDVGSTKSQIMDALDKLPDNFHPIGGHPICGKETLSAENSEADLFKGAPFVLIRAKRSSDAVEHLALETISAIGADPVWLNADTHDRILASTSHLPFVIASTLVRAIGDESKGLIGTGLRSTARLAGTPTSMMVDVLETNRENILESIKQYRAKLDEIENAVRSGDRSRLKVLLDSSKEKYHALVTA